MNDNNLLKELQKEVQAHKVKEQDKKEEYCSFVDTKLEKKPVLQYKKKSGEYITNVSGGTLLGAFVGGFIGAVIGGIITATIMRDEI